MATGRRGFHHAIPLQQRKQVGRYSRGESWYLPPHMGTVRYSGLVVGGRGSKVKPVCGEHRLCQRGGLHGHIPGFGSAGGGLVLGYERSMTTCGRRGKTAKGSVISPG